jgi:CRISPR-associated protein Csx17
LGKFDVVRRPQADILTELDQWLQKFMRRAAAEDAPASITRCLRTLEETIFILCRKGGNDNLLDLIISLGNCERQVARSSKWTRDEKKGVIQPLGGFSPKWALMAYDGTTEYRLALATASSTILFNNTEKQAFRTYLEPIKVSGRQAKWDDDSRANWSESDLLVSMNEVMTHQIQDQVKAGLQNHSVVSCVPCNDTDVRALIEGDVDDRRLEELVWSLALARWNEQRPDIRGPRRGRSGDVFATMRLCYSNLMIGDRPVPLKNEVHSLAAAGNGARATQAAVRNIRGNGLNPKLGQITLSSERSKRMAAALLIPMDNESLAAMIESLKIEK